MLTVCVPTTVLRAKAAHLSVLTSPAPTTVLCVKGATLSVLTVCSPTTALSLHRRTSSHAALAIRDSVKHQQSQRLPACKGCVAFRAHSTLATTALHAQAVRRTVLTVCAPTTVLRALAVLLSVLTNPTPTTALRALAAQLAVLAVVELNPNTLGVHAPVSLPPLGALVLCIRRNRIIHRAHKAIQGDECRPHWMSLLRFSWLSPKLDRNHLKGRPRRQCSVFSIQ